MDSSTIRRLKFPKIDMIKKYINEGVNLFITGSGGTGKSTNLIEIRKHLHKTGKKYKVTAPTGIAAINVKGTTLHSFVGLGLADKDKEILCLMTQANKALYKRWNDLDVLIIDEISMIDIDFFIKVEYIARNIRNDDSPFGGIQLIFVGDFFQLPPVNMSTSSSGKKEKYIFENKIWQDLNITTIELTKNMRQDNKEFFDVLNEVRWGSISDKSYEILKKCEGVNFKDSIKPTILFSTNKNVDELNNLHYEKLKGKEHSYVGEITWTGHKHENYYKKIGENITNSSRAKLQLNLKEGAQVILLANIHKKGLANGSRAVITGFENSYPVVEFKHITTEIKPYSWTKDLEENGSVTYSQVPLKLAYAITIHSSQSLTIDKLSVNLGGIFECGQAYTALSRSTSLDGLVIKNLSRGCIKAHKKVIEFYKNLNKDEK